MIELLNMYFTKLKRLLEERSIEYTSSNSNYIKIVINNNVYLDFKYPSNKLLYIGVQIENYKGDLTIIKNQMKEDGFDDAIFAVCKKETKFNLGSDFENTVKMLYNENDIFNDILEVFQIVKDKYIF